MSDAPFSPNDPMNHVNEIEMAARNLMGMHSAEDVMKDQSNVATLTQDSALFQSFKSAYPENYGMLVWNMNQQFDADSTVRPNLPTIQLLDDGSINIHGAVPGASGTRAITAGRESLSVKDSLQLGA